MYRFRRILLLPSRGDGRLRFECGDRRGNLRRLLTSVAPRCRPALQRLATFVAETACQYPLDADVFVEVGPFHRVTVAQKPVVLPLRGRCVQQTRIPRQRHHDAAAVGKFYRQLFLVTATAFAKGSVSNAKVFHATPPIKSARVLLPGEQSGLFHVPRNRDSWPMPPVPTKTWRFADLA